MARTVKELASNIERYYSAKSNKDVQIGIFKPEIAQYARFNNYGTRNIPPRPFMTSFLRTQEGALATYVITHFDNFSFQDFGTFASDRLRFFTQTYAWTPNAPSTVRAKGHATPLVDTGAMIKAITYRILPL